MVKNLPAMQEMWVLSLSQEDPPKKGMATYSSILPGEFHGQRSLVGYGPWGHKQLDMTEQLRTIPTERQRMSELIKKSNTNYMVNRKIYSTKTLTKRKLVCLK